MTDNQRWVSVWGNAVSVAENRPERYAKNITIRYPIHVPFGGKGVRLTFDNYCGTEPVTLNKVTVLYGGKCHPVFLNGNREMTMEAGERIVTDPLEVEINEGEILQVSFYLKDFTLMRSVVFLCPRASMPTAMKQKPPTLILKRPEKPIYSTSSAMFPC